MTPHTNFGIYDRRKPIFPQIALSTPFTHKFPSPFLFIVFPFVCSGAIDARLEIEMRLQCSNPCRAILARTHAGWFLKNQNFCPARDEMAGKECRQECRQLRTRRLRTNRRPQSSRPQLSSAIVVSAIARPQLSYRRNSLYFSDTEYTTLVVFGRG